MRIALYSHDAMGLGHLRRNLAIARALGALENVSTLLITGAREAAAFPAPDGVDYLTVPGFAKDEGGGYHPRFLKTSSSRLVRLRATTMRAALEAFDPHAMIVDKHPLGLFGELEPALDVLAERGTTCVLGLRDVLDRPARARSEWAASGGDEAVRRRYAQVWVYGDPRIYDVVRECGLGEAVAARARYTGYLSRGRDLRRTAPDPDVELPDGRLVLCTVGGGQDGYALGRAFAEAEMPPDTHGLLVAGPLMAAAQRDELRRCAGARVTVLDFVADPLPLIDRADAIVAMGGYNTVCELLARDKPALIVPRVAPRAEQLIRARRLERAGHVDVLRPHGELPARIAQWLRRPAGGEPKPRIPIDLDGLDRIPAMMERALALGQVAA